MFCYLCRTQGRTLVYILCHMRIHFDQIPRFSHTFQMDDRVVCKLNHLEKQIKTFSSSVNEDRIIVYFFFTNVTAAHKGFEIFRSNGNCRKRLYIISPVSPMFIHPMTRLKFLISSVQSPYNIQSIHYYSSITKFNLWPRSNYFFRFLLVSNF